MIGVFGPLAVVISLGEASALPTSDNVILSFCRNYGRSVFSQCRLDVVVYESRGNVALWCDSTSSDGKGSADPGPERASGTDFR